MQTIDGRIRKIFSDAEKEAAVFINDLVYEINITLNLNETMTTITMEYFLNLF